MSKRSGLVLWLSEIGKEDARTAGGKGANLGEMVRAGFPVPNGFVISSHAYNQFIKDNNLTLKIKHTLATVDYHRPESLLIASSHIKKYIMQAEMSHALISEIFSAYKHLGGIFSDAVVAVRSSATAEDSKNASFAGQQETFLNVTGEANVLQRVKETWASLFEARAIFYRHERNINHFSVGIAIVIQKMVAADKSGVLFTIDPVTSDKSKIIIEAIYGLGEYLAQGHVTPDHYEVSKKDLLITKKVAAVQTVKLEKVANRNKEMKITSHEGKQQKISDKEIVLLAELGKRLEKHYFFAQDCEWAIEKGKLYVVQTRPVTTAHKTTETPAHGLDEIAAGVPGAPGIASGPVRVVSSPQDIHKVQPGEILVLHTSSTEYEPAIKKARAVIAEVGGRTSHAALFSRELGIPTVVGVTHVTKNLKSGHIVTVNGSKGTVHKGALTQYGSQNEIHASTKTATKVYLTIDELTSFESTVEQAVDGVGLLQAEKIIKSIGVHPKKLIHDEKEDSFVEKLTEQLATACKKFHPRPVMYRLSNLTTSGYRELLGGKAYEPIEPNPLIGYRGAFRYMHDHQILALELEAIKRIRNKAGLKNIWLLLPFVRSVQELAAVKRMIAASGLHRSPSFQLWVTVSTPANIFMLDQFIETGIDGISIDSDSLATLFLGIDRENEEVAPEYDDFNPAIMWAYERIIGTAKKHHIPCSLHGHAPAMHPSLIESLVKWGITSISVAPNEVETTKEVVAATERKIITKHQASSSKFQRS